MLFEPRLGLLLRDDREDFDGFVPDVIEHPHFAYAEAVLRFVHASEPFYPALAHPLRLMAQMRFNGLADLGAQSSWQRSQVLPGLRGQDDLEAHSGQNLARGRRPNKAMELTALEAASRGRVASGARLGRRGAAPRPGRSSSPIRWAARTTGEVKLDSDTVKLAIIIACGVVSSAVRLASTRNFALALVTFILLDLVVNSASLAEPGLSHGQRVASAVFVVALPTGAAFTTARIKLWAARPFLAAVAAVLAYVVVLFLALTFAVNTGLLVP